MAEVKHWSQIIKPTFRRLAMSLLLGASLLLGGCSGNVGVGLSVGVPIGNHGYMSVGGSRWY
jgi:hypothetical protein